MRSCWRLIQQRKQQQWRRVQCGEQSGDSPLSAWRVAKSGRPSQIELKRAIIGGGAHSSRLATSGAAADEEWRSGCAARRTLIAAAPSGRRSHTPPPHQMPVSAAVIKGGKKTRDPAHSSIVARKTCSLTVCSCAMARSCWRPAPGVSASAAATHMLSGQAIDSWNSKPFNTIAF